MPWTAKGAKRALEAFLGQTQITGSQGFLWLGLHTSIPTEGDDAQQRNEISAESYGRIRNVPEQWTVNDNVASINIDKNWPTPAEEWGIPMYLGIWTEEDGGDLLAYQVLSEDAAKILTNMAVFTNAGDVVLTISLS